jgi:SAM-dependent methyltransferase
MVDDFACPVCRADDWEVLARHRYPGAPDLTDYERLRMRVLHEVWFDGSESVELRSTLCRSCGFAAYTPRPTVEDIDEKYGFLALHEPAIGGSDNSGLGLRLDSRRARETFDAVASRSLPSRVLDLGGGDGKLLAPFADAGSECFLLDYNPDPMPGVTRLGATLDDLDPGVRFDAVVCSHVLEHLAEPRETLERLAAHVEPGGVLFAEVPAELWRRVPIDRDPVTHVNFFTTGSLRALLERSGFAPATVKQVRGSYGRNRKDVVRAVATPGPAGRETSAVAEARRRLSPSFWMRLRRAIRRRVLR